MTNERDPNVEPENSTVTDWLGQQVQRDEEEIDQLLEETGGDVAAAEKRFKPGD
jgi:hypothetical protein